MKKAKCLSELRVGECGKIKRLEVSGSLRRRFLDIGFMQGTRIECVGKSPFGDPRAYFLRGCEIAIRQKDAEKIIVE